MNDLYVTLDNCIFDFEYYVLKLRKVKRHLSVFSICISISICSSNFCNIDMDPHYYF